MEVHPCPEKFKHAGEIRPMVVLFGWLLAKSRHLHKYGELYHQHGADVITVKLEVMEVKRLNFVHKKQASTREEAKSCFLTLPLPALQVGEEGVPANISCKGHA